MGTRTHILIRMATLTALYWLLGVSPAASQGIPLPGITVYGVITDQSGATRLTSGSLEITYTPTGGGGPVTVRTNLADLNGQFSYAVNVPVEIKLEEFDLSAGALALPESSVTYSRSAMIDSQELSIVGGNAEVTLSADEHRGSIQRIDFQAGGPVTQREDADGNGRVERKDLLAWFQGWKATQPVRFDFDGDGVIDSPDLLVLLEAIYKSK